MREAAGEHSPARHAHYGRSIGRKARDPQSLLRDARQTAAQVIEHGHSASWIESVKPAQYMAAQPIQARLADPDLIRGQILIEGQWCSADNGDLQPVRNPATGDWVGSIAAAGAQETARAIRSAQQAWPAWRALLPQERGDILREWARLMRGAQDDLALIMTLEQGKPLFEARGEIDYAASFLDWFAAEAARAYGETIPSHLPARQMMTVREPIGVAAAVTPWNFPSAMITRKAGAALAAGCPIIIRPACETPFSALALGVLAERAGIPRGVLSVITGPPKPIVEVLTSSEEVRALSFTGSTEVGRLLLEQSAGSIKRVSLELGGHAPFIVFEDADVEQAVKWALAAKFQTSGQDCLAANRILVHRSLTPRFREAFAAQTQALRVGNGLDPDVAIGPLISEKAVSRCESHVRDAVERGATVLTGGGRHPAGKNFFAPTVLDGVTPEMRICREETFGPVAPILSFESEEEAIHIANDTIYGLAAYICTPNLARALRVGRRLEYGMVAINTSRFTGPPIPFGGMKQSGLGREGSRHGLDDYTELKYLCIGLE
jgi:succinate-semialdehyde dehydrogenase